jgi:hypothetical protein
LSRYFSVILMALNMSWLALTPAHASTTTCAEIFKTPLTREQVALSAADSETIKTYIFQGPIINFYLRNVENPANAVISKALFETNGLDEGKVQTILLNLDRVLEQQRLSRVRQTVYRGEGRPNDGSLRVGARLRYPNYISTTRDKSLAMGYANGNAQGLKVFYEITVDRGQPGAQINLLAPEGVRNQDEFLLARNGILIVNEITVVEGVTYVKATYRSHADE